MQQFQFTYSSVERALSGVGEIRAKLDAVPHRDAAAFVFVIACDRQDVGRLLEAWDHRLPEVRRAGISEGYEITDKLEMKIVFNLILSGQETFHPIQIPCAPGEEAAAAAKLVEFASGVSDLRAIALYPSNRRLNITRFLLSGCQNVPVFGAAAAPIRKSSSQRNVFAMQEGVGIGETLLDSGFTALLIGGAGVQVLMEYILGWSAIGREMEIELEENDSVGETKIRLIDGSPAVEIYRKYLGVEWDGNFIRNVCEFPLMVRRKGVDICQIPMDNRNGSLTLPGTIGKFEKLRFSYSTPETILGAAREGSERMAAFDADAVVMSLCGNRTSCLREDAHLEWDYYREKNPDLAFCHGYSEIAYNGGRGGVLSSAFVVLGLRECGEGEANPASQSVFITSQADTEAHAGRIPLSYRVSHFFHIMTEELVHMQHHLEDEVARKTRENERLSFHVVQTLAEAIDAKDTYTNGHSSRVAQYAREIARRAGYDKEDQEQIYMLGLLHDVGKIGVPDAVINKPGRLNDDEFALIKTHPVTGARILHTIDEMPELMTGAKYHHERYDGRGYPEGLAGLDIPEEARIIGVADAYDAMTSNRSYRGSMDQQVVRQQIEQGMGTQFDPRFAKIMLQMMDEDVDYQMREH